MAAIDFRPTTGGQTFGDAGQLFDKALTRITSGISGAESTFDKFRQGQEEVKKQRTEDILSSIRAIQSPDALQQLQLPSDESEVDISAIRDAITQRASAIPQETLQRGQTDEALRALGVTQAGREVARQFQPLAPEARDTANVQSTVDQVRQALQGIPNITLAERQAQENQILSGLGLDPDTRLRAIQQSVPTIKGKTNKSEFINAARARGFSNSQIEAFIKSEKDITGQTLVEAEAKRQQLRKEALEDALRKAQIKNVAELDSPARLDLTINALQSDDDLFWLGDTSQTKAKNFKGTMLELGAPISLIASEINKATGEQGEIRKEDLDEAIARFKESKKNPITPIDPLSTISTQDLINILNNPATR